MSNRRKPRNAGATDLLPGDHLGVEPFSFAGRNLPWPLNIIEWADLPQPTLGPKVLEWVAGKHQERGRYNVWECEVCGADFLAYDRHPGTTPFAVAHDRFDPAADCEGITTSTFYAEGRARQALGAKGGPSHEWYRPSADELRTLGKHAAEHVHQGGLLVRPVPA